MNVSKYEKYEQKFFVLIKEKTLQFIILKKQIMEKFKINYGHSRDIRMSDYLRNFSCAFERGNNRKDLYLLNQVYIFYRVITNQLRFCHSD